MVAEPIRDPIAQGAVALSSCNREPQAEAQECTKGVGFQAQTKCLGNRVLAKPEGGRGEPRHQPQRAGRLFRLHPELSTGVVAGQGLERRARRAALQQPR